MDPKYLAEDNSGPLLRTCILFLVLESLFIALLYVGRYFSREDRANLSMVLLMTSAYVVCVCKITIGILDVEIGGAGKHLATLTPSTLSTGLKLNTALQIVCPLTTSLSKLSVLCLFDSIFGRTSRRYRIVIRATFILVVIILLVQVIIPFANCKPFSHTWNPMGPGSCAIDALVLWRYLSLPNVLTTVIIVGIPLPALYRLNISMSTRLGLAVVLSVCCVGLVAAIMRFWSFLAVQDFRDITYECVRPLCWTIAESGIYLVAGVLPTLRPLIKKVCDGKSLSSRASGSWGSWGNRRWSRMVLKGENAVEGEKAEKTYSDASSKGTIVGLDMSSKGTVVEVTDVEKGRTPGER